MPQNITIAAFVLGAVLLLIAILRGGFKIFGAEVDGTAGRFSRIFAGLLGVILTGIGLFSSLYRPSSLPTSGPQKAASDGSSSGQATSTNASTPHSQAQMGKTETNQSQSEQTVNIAGTWHDFEGNEFQISQHGNEFTIRITGMSYEASSSGALHGHDFERTYEGHMIETEGQMTKGTRFSGHCSGTVSDNVSVMRANCFDEKGGRGPWQSVLTR
jgi:hypothetical protein